MVKIVRRTVSTDQEKSIITGLIVSDKFIKALETTLKANLSLLKTSYARTVTKWCLDFYEKYKVSPKKNIQEIYEHKKSSLDEDVILIISELLSGLSNNFEREEKFNEDYAIDKALLYINEQKLDDLLYRAKEAKNEGKLEEANKLLREYKRIEKPKHESIDVFRDVDKILELLNQESDGIFTMPGAIGEMLGPLDRGDFFAIAAPAKRGKTFWLIDIALRAVFTGLRVVFFSLEMSEKKMLTRIYQNLLGELKYMNYSGEMSVMLPQFVEDDVKKGKFRIEYREVRKTGLTDQKVVKKARAMEILARQGRFKLICVPNSSMTVEEVYDNIMEETTKENVVPDMIVVDYADIINSSYRTEKRHQIDHTWRYLRRMADEMHSIVATVTHTAKKTLEKDIRQGDLSEDSRKLNHVSLMWALNQSEKDLEMGTMRACVLGSRFEGYRVNQEVIITQNLEIGKPFLDSRWKSSVLAYGKKS